MLIAKSMEFRPSAQKEKRGACAVGQSRLQHDKLQTVQYTGGHTLILDAD